MFFPIPITWLAESSVSFSHSVTAQVRPRLFKTFLEAVIVVCVLQQFPWFPFYKFWGQEGRAFYSSEHFLAFLHRPIVSFGPHFQ